MPYRLVFSIASLIMLSSPISASEVGYKFSGMVLVQSSAPWGKPMPPIVTSVNGKFIYDSTSPATHTFPCDGECIGYRQQIVNGFSAKFGNVFVRADDYLVSINNDVPKISNPDERQDNFVISFRGNLDPALTGGLFVDGQQYLQGYFNINLTASSEEFSDASLPSMIDPANFPSRIGVLSDANPGEGPVQVTFSVISLTKFDVVRGDYTLDGIVNSADYDRWRSTFSSTIDIAADGNRDRIIDAADYVVWRKAMGTVASSGLASASRASVATPEPAAAALLLVGFFLLRLVGSRQRQLA